MRTQIWSVTTLVGYLKNSLENDMVIQSILVKGEISNFTNHRSGHLYFSLKDGNASIPCVMFSSNARKMKIIPKEGMQVIVGAKVSLYEPRGSVQLYVQSMQSDGLGDLYLRFEELKKKLYMEGLFDPAHKKTLPNTPFSIGVISARTGAAIQDVLSIIARRWPLCDVKVYPSLVQGEFAAKDMISKLAIADENGHDVILLVRGGGSMEDLWCFNDESLSRFIYGMKTCIVSGVGHETDTTLVDYVSDFRAPTPSAAAELVTPDYKEYLTQIHLYQKRLVSAMDYKLQSAKKELKYYKEKKIFTDPFSLLQNAQIRFLMASSNLEKYEQHVKEKRHLLNLNKEKLILYLDHYSNMSIKTLEYNEQALCKKVDEIKNKNREHLNKHIGLLDAYSPLKILNRGYAILLHEEKAVRSVQDVSEKDILNIRVSDGDLYAEVIERKKSNGK